MRIPLALPLLLAALLPTAAFANVEGPYDTAPPATEKTITLTQSELKAMIAAEVQHQLHDLIAAEQKDNVRRAVDAAVSSVEVLQSEVELYRIQHHGNAPTLAQLQKNWAPLLNRTNADGDILPDGPFGPYLRSPPVNMILNNTQVAAAGEANSSVGWTYDEKTHTFRMVVPGNIPWPADKRNRIEVYEVTSDTQRTQREHAVASDLQTLRSQLELYRIQHNDLSPTAAQMENWNVLVQKTNRQGETTGKTSCGPYLVAPPINPINGMSRIAPRGHADASTGWTYDATNGEIYAAIPKGFHLGSLSTNEVELYNP